MRHLMRSQIATHAENWPTFPTRPPAQPDPREGPEGQGVRTAHFLDRAGRPQAGEQQAPEALKACAGLARGVIWWESLLGAGCLLLSVAHRPWTGCRTAAPDNPHYVFLFYILLIQLACILGHSGFKLRSISASGVPPGDLWHNPRAIQCHPERQITNRCKNNCYTKFGLFDRLLGRAVVSSPRRSPSTAGKPELQFSG